MNGAEWEKVRMKHEGEGTFSNIIDYINMVHDLSLIEHVIWHKSQFYLK